MICATAIAIGLHLGTYHFDRSKEYNEVNLGIYAMCDGYTAGYYRNSYHRDSFYAGYTWEKGPFALTAGAVTGYRRGIKVGGEYIAPMVMPSVKLGHVRLTVVPPVGRVDGGVHFSVEF